MVRKDVPAKLIIEILLAMVQAIMNPPKMEELGMMPKEGFSRDPQDCSRRRAYAKRTESVNASFVRQIDNLEVIGAREFIRS